MSGLTPLAAILRRYAFAYTAMHDFSVSDQIMADDYVLRMGPLVIKGRLEEYQPATAQQYRQFPGLGFTVHRLVTNGERAALHFTEHGRSLRSESEAAWQGISLYRWDGRVLTECRVEQDYYSRRQQLASGQPHEVMAPGRDPWTSPEQASNSAVEDAVRTWLSDPQWRRDPGVSHDDGSGQAVISEERTEVLDLFSAGTSVAFHAVVTGTYTGGLGSDDELVGRPADLYACGIVDVGSGSAPVRGVVVTDRLSLLRRLRSRG